MAHLVLTLNSSGCLFTKCKCLDAVYNSNKLMIKTINTANAKWSRKTKKIIGKFYTTVIQPLASTRAYCMLISLLFIYLLVSFVLICFFIIYFILLSLYLPRADFLWRVCNKVYIVKGPMWWCLCSIAYTSCKYGSLQNANIYR